MEINVVSTGSKGNAVIISGRIMIDCGVSWKLLAPFVGPLKLVLLTHIHSDHLKKTTIKRLVKERPGLRYGCLSYLAPALVDYGVPKSQIDVLTDRAINTYGIANVIPFELTHNVPNCGYKIEMDGEKLIYATDTNNLNGITARNFDYYLIEANYEDAEIQERIRQKEEAGEYVYEKSVIRNHLSKAKADAWLAENAGPNSKFLYMHRHEEARS